MTTLDDKHTSSHTQGGAHGGHGHWLMMACCVPMLVIAIVLVATGVASVGFIFVAIMCTAMMAMMMRGMSSGGSGGEKR
jgi:hypothetical protein